MTGSLPLVEPPLEPTSLLPCAYRGPHLGTRVRKESSGGGHVYLCRHARVQWTVAERCATCSWRQQTPLAAACDQITPVAHGSLLHDLEKAPEPEAAKRSTRKPQRLRLVSFPPQPAHLFVTRDGQPCTLANAWYPGHLFVILSGPSLNTFPLHRLSERGIVTLAVNNAACVVRPTFWTCIDPVEKFHNVIWEDPGIIKLVPVGRFNKHVRIQQADGSLKYVDRIVASFPGVFGYQHGANFNPETYLIDNEVCIGNSFKRSLGNGRPHVLNVMFTVPRLAYALGFRHVYLLGCDFRMQPQGPHYAFETTKSESAVESNNIAYLKLNAIFTDLQPRFLKAGLFIYNCTPNSGLLAFPYLPFEDALRHAKKNIPDPIWTQGWYVKGKSSPR